nr:30S ribosomal protein S6 [Planctomycetota bacterium]
MTTRKKTYECMLLLDNREVKKGWDALKDQIDSILTKYGAKIVVAKRWDERKLAYEIKKQRRATYYLSYLEADPQSMTELEHMLRLSGPVLRHLVLACEEIPG